MRRPWRRLNLKFKVYNSKFKGRRRRPMLDSPDKLTIGVTGVNAGVQNEENKGELDGAVCALNRSSGFHYRCSRQQTQLPALYFKQEGKGHPDVGDQDQRPPQYHATHKTHGPCSSRLKSYTPCYIGYLSSSVGFAYSRGVHNAFAVLSSISAGTHLIFSLQPLNYNVCSISRDLFSESLLFFLTPLALQHRPEGFSQL